VLAKGDAMIKNAKDWGNTRAIYPHELRTAQDRIKELEQQLAAGQSHAPDPDMASDLLQCRSLTAAWKRRAEVAEAELGALRSRQAEPQPAPDAPQPSARPKRDRTEYMREFMRKKRAASRFENINLRTYDVTS
jgi:hypothetical protein